MRLLVYNDGLFALLGCCYAAHPGRLLYGQRVIESGRHRSWPPELALLGPSLLIGRSNF